MRTQYSLFLSALLLGSCSTPSDDLRFISLDRDGSSKKLVLRFESDTELLKASDVPGLWVVRVGLCPFHGNPLVGMGPLNSVKPSPNGTSATAPYQYVVRFEDDWQAWEQYGDSYGGYVFQHVDAPETPQAWCAQVKKPSIPDALKKTEFRIPASVVWKALAALKESP